MSEQKYMIYHKVELQTYTVSTFLFLKNKSLINFSFLLNGSPRWMKSGWLWKCSCQLLGHYISISQSQVWNIHKQQISSYGLGQQKDCGLLQLTKKSWKILFLYLGLFID